MGENESWPDVPLYVNEEVRNLAEALLQAFDTFLINKPDPLGIGLASTNQVFRFSVIVIILKVLDGSREKALENLSRLGELKNDAFPSTLEDHYYRTATRDKIDESRQNGHPIANAIIGTSAFLTAVISDNLSNRDATQRFGRDPLEALATLQNENDTDPELLIFLEHYLPYELAETIRDLADTRCEKYSVNPRPAAVLIEFDRCFHSFTIVRTSLPRPDRKFSRFLDDSHARLRRLAEIVKEAALLALIKAPKTGPS